MTETEAPEVPITHNLPILAPGSADPCVHELGRKLADLGFPNSVSQGKNPFGAVDQSIISAVDSFRAQNHIPGPDSVDSPYNGRLRGWHLDPLTTQAILELHDTQSDTAD